MEFTSLFNMRAFLAFAFIGCVVATSSEFSSFHNYAKNFGKSYADAKEASYRRSIFEQNNAKIVEHNKKYAAGEVTWFMKMYEDMDLTEQEFMHKRTGLPSMTADFTPVDQLDSVIEAKVAALGPAPKEWSWVSSGMVSSVKNQAQCGSCAAFAALGAIESCFMINNADKADDLSEQHLLDCAYNHQVTDSDGTWGAFGCDGAWPNAYLDWIQGNYNQEESSYPYTSGRSGDVGKCSPSNNGAHQASMVTGFQNKWYTEENDMETMLQINPVVTAVLATNNWGGYGGGVLDDYLCCDAATDSSCVYNLNHAVLVVGYGTEGGQDYWLIKNSWGKSWGENGFFKLKRGTGHCGVGALEQAVPRC